MQIDLNLDNLGAEKKEEVLEIVEQFMDDVRVTFAEELSERIKIRKVTFHAIVDDVPMIFESEIERA